MYNLSTNDPQLAEYFDNNDARGDLHYARELADTFCARITLTDEQGLRRGYVRANGDWSVN